MATVGLSRRSFLACCTALGAASLNTRRVFAQNDQMRTTVNQWPWTGTRDAVACNYALGHLGHNLRQRLTIEGRIHAETYISAVGDRWLRSSTNAICRDPASGGRQHQSRCRRIRRAILVRRYLELHVGAQDSGRGESMCLVIGTRWRGGCWHPISTGTKAGSDFSIHRVDDWGTERRQVFRLHGSPTSLTST
jgi:hypothetical protein